ncbi:MAG: TolB family protein [Actinomycetota bacterium]
MLTGPNASAGPKKKVFVTSPSNGASPAAGIAVGTTPIAFSSDRDASAGEMHLWRVNPDGSGLAQLTTGAGQDDENARWSPDGKEIAFQRSEGASYDIWVTAADGSEQIALTRSAGDETNPAWSPNGKRILYDHWAGSENFGSGLSSLWTMRADGSHQRRLVRHGEAGDYSPDGTRIVFSALRPNGLWALRTIRQGASHSRTFIAPGGADAYDPAWSPDGHWIAYGVVDCSTNPQCDLDIYVVQPSGKGNQLVTTNGYQPRWSPDGTQLTFTESIGVSDDVMTVGRDGTGLTDVTPGTSSFDGFSDWSPI